MEQIPDRPGDPGVVAAPPHDQVPRDATHEARSNNSMAGGS
jgi:hypothetical protein